MKHGHHVSSSARYASGRHSKAGKRRFLLSTYRPVVFVVRPSFPMMTITSSMMMIMMMSCLVDHVVAEVANQSNSGLQHSSVMIAHNIAYYMLSV